VRPKRWPIEDGQLSPNALSSGDLNGDGRPDLVLLAESHLYFLAQKEDHTLAEPEKIPFSGGVKSAQIVDIDGDGLNDLLLVNWEDRNPYFDSACKSRAASWDRRTISRSRRSGRIGAANLEANRKTQVVTIAQNSGRAQISGVHAQTRGGPFRLVYQGPVSIAAAE
jgi:hypothetical protein